MKRIIGIAAAAAAVALLVSGCSASGSGPSPTSEGTQQGGTLTVLSQATAIDWDPATSVDLPTTWQGLIDRRLTTWEVQPGQDAKVVPDLATDTGTPSDDGTTWTYTLKDGVTFQDGTPITSKDVKFGVERTFAPDLSSGLGYHKALLVGGADYAGPFDGAELASIETPDDKTIVFHLTTAYGDWPWIVSMNPFVPVPVGGGDPATYGKSPVASGPYQVESNEDGKQTVLVRNENWDPDTDDVRTAGPDKIVFLQNQSSATTTQSLVGDIGDAKTSINSEPLGAAELAQINANPEAKKRLVTSEAGSLNYVAMNTERGALKDVQVRQALQYAIDRHSVVIAQGGSQAAEPATTLITPGIPGRADFDLYPAGESGDVDKAKQLLQDAGYDGSTLVMWVTNDDASQAMGQAVQQGLEKAGVKIELKPLDPNTFYGDAMGGNPDYDLLLSWWLPDFPSALANLGLMFDSSQIDGGFNFARYSNPDVDAKIAAATAETDPASAQSMWAALDKQIMGDAPVIPLTFSKNSFLGGSSLRNYFVAAYPPYQNYLKMSLAQ